MDGNNQTRRLLLMGFGGLLLLLAFAGLNGVSIVNAVQARNERIRNDYTARDRILQQLRFDIYRSGTYLRDLLLEPDPVLAGVHRKEFEKARIQIDANCALYARILLKEERQPFQQFRNELNRYFTSLEPALRWGPAQRRQLGYAFMKQSLLPERMAIVSLADQLSALNEKQLEIGNKQVADLFGIFRRSLILFTVLSLICGALLAGISVRRILRLEDLSSARFREVLHTRTALRDLSARLVEAQESERRAISRELHDEVGQSVSGLLLGIGNVSATLSPERNAGALTQLQELRGLAEKTVSMVRDLSLFLRPSMLDDLGLLPALQWQAREISRTKNISVQVSADPILEESLSDEQKTCIYRVVQEALMNVTRHAHAASVQVLVAEENGKSLSLSIQDDGIGFVPGRDKGVGLLGMEERVRHLNGDFRIDSQPGSGTCIRIQLPIPQLVEVELG